MSVRGCERGPGPRRGAIGPKFPHVMRGAAGARPARGRPASDGPAGTRGPGAPGKGSAWPGPRPAAAARGVPEPPTLLRLPKSGHPPLRAWPAPSLWPSRLERWPPVRAGLGPPEGAELPEPERRVLFREVVSGGLINTRSTVLNLGVRRWHGGAAPGCPTCPSSRQAAAHAQLGGDATRSACAYASFDANASKAQL
ncbi:unnamed protein product, partial [Bubo scandiacus]